ncbi:hypothetical protein BC349_10015 [Flavihumibacter stibioxidans]|uniref:Uncharacterized protein n=1 Tax=Flavihumibacter stibioxidans TaxID=1834163 RepID=A0ABR7M8L9_9BACT|nr:hypothetical protein [Flavihumibacter stibioxidans]
MLLLALLVSNAIQAGLARCPRLKAGARQMVSITMPASGLHGDSAQATEVCSTGSQYSLRNNQGLPVPPVVHVSRYMIPLNETADGEDHSILHFPPPRQ